MSDPAPCIDDIEAFLLARVAELAPEPARAGPGRPRILPALLLWLGLLVCVLRGWSSQRAVWRLLSTSGLWAYPRLALSDEAVYKRLAAGGTAPLEALFAQLSAVLATRLAAWPALGGTELAPFAPLVVAMDRTMLDPVLRTLPALRALRRGDHALLPGALHGLFDVRAQQWRTLRYTDQPRQNEKVLARALVAEVPAGSLVLMDRGYFGFRLFDDLTDAGYWWISRCQRTVSSTVAHTLYARDGVTDELVWLGAWRANQARHLVRRVAFPVGAHHYTYVTNVLDPAVLSVPDIARLYARRWDIELAFRTVKQYLGLHLLWSAKPPVVAQQVWAVLIIAQVLQALRLEIAGRAGVDPFDVSLPLLAAYAPQFAARGIDPVAAIVTEGRATGFIRPARRRALVLPTIDAAAIVPPPPDLPRQRVPRYKHPPPPAPD